MNTNLFSYWKLYWIAILLLGIGTQVSGQSDTSDTFNEEIQLEVNTTGRLLSPNKLIMMVEVEVPKGWKLEARGGYGSILEGELDTLAMTLKFQPSAKYQLVQRLKAARKPSPKGYYYEKITFAQTLRIDSSKLPIYIDAEFKFRVASLDEKKISRNLPCCLLQVCKKRRKTKTIRVGWKCKDRGKVYLEDILY